jgi:hypothetical protein
MPAPAIQFETGWPADRGDIGTGACVVVSERGISASFVEVDIAS